MDYREYIVIEGITEEGEVFRPSDWAERMSGNLSTFKNQRIIYSPMLRPIVHDGHKCVILDIHLKSSNPSLFEEIMNFAKKNHLRIFKIEPSDPSST